ncbi:hypothetical protein FRX31_025721 [Thalictrum thalictroides]|uniref:AT3G52170-like helix-turn-helix domain-containing protein n=1 Tax=Thalictrum thalictroides TaxID=46969 RepID=A0A7J6VHV7_THATH|nr:hypothetical protein FRX31_025721 [Thalictrum thalictroides]
MQAVRGLSRSALSSSKTTSASSISVSVSLRSSPFFNNKDISNAIINGSNLHCCSRGRYFAALVPSDSNSSSSTPQRGPKRVSKHERRAMLKAFVDKYRASNSGKYPTPSAAQKQVGGCYYVVKKILQEIEYNSQKSSVIISTTNEAPFEKEVPQEECPPFPEAKEILSSATGADLTSSAQSLGLKDDSQAVATTNLDMDEATSSINQAKEETLGAIEMSFSKDALNPKTPVNASNADEDHSPPKRATVWGNLKSFADGIINMWRKM